MENVTNMLKLFMDLYIRYIGYIYIKYILNIEYILNIWLLVLVGGNKEGKQQGEEKLQNFTDITDLYCIY